MQATQSNKQHTQSQQPATQRPVKPRHVPHRTPKTPEPAPQPQPRQHSPRNGAQKPTQPERKGNGHHGDEKRRTGHPQGRHHAPRAKETVYHAGDVYHLRQRFENQPITALSQRMIQTELTKLRHAEAVDIRAVQLLEHYSTQTVGQYHSAAIVPGDQVTPQQFLKRIKTMLYEAKLYENELYRTQDPDDRVRAEQVFEQAVKLRFAKVEFTRLLARNDIGPRRIRRTMAELAAQFGISLVRDEALSEQSAHDESFALSAE